MNIPGARQRGVAIGNIPGAGQRGIAVAIGQMVNMRLCGVQWRLAEFAPSPNRGQIHSMPSWSPSIAQSPNVQIFSKGR